MEATSRHRDFLVKELQIACQKDPILLDGLRADIVSVVRVDHLDVKSPVPEHVANFLKIAVDHEALRLHLWSQFVTWSEVIELFSASCTLGRSGSAISLLGSRTAWLGVSGLFVHLH